MATITLQSPHRKIARYELSAKKATRIGRLADNDIVIENLAVSGRHAEIIPDKMGFIIKDLGSRNGTFIGGKPIDSRRLVHGDTVTLGKHELIFSDQPQDSGDASDLKEENASPSARQGAAVDSTVFLETKQQKEMLAQYDRSGHKSPLLVVKYKDKMLYKYLLKFKTTTIGRDSGNKIVIDNSAVSAEHAVITFDNTGFTISDLNSKNGIFVNKKPVKECKLHNGDIITIGRHALVFEQAGTYTLDEVAQPLADGPAFNSSTETFFLSTKEYQAMMANSPGAGSTPGFTFLKGGEGYAPIEKKMFQIGKSKTSDIVVKGLTIGDTAALVTSKADGYYLTYQSGFSKPLVNGKKVKASIKLNDGDIVEIGSVKLEFKA